MLAYLSSPYEPNKNKKMAAYNRFEKISPPLLTTNTDEEKAPILGSWRNIYLFVLLLHALLILFFYFFSQRYA